MDDNTGGAGPALAAHSKDGSAAGQTAASRVTGQQQRTQVSPETVGRVADQLGELVRRKPAIAMLVAGAVGLCVGRMLSRR
jgi:ElaB/YqjD/DUF883 family membrane-anchored ribosome-binding protein